MRILLIDDELPWINFVKSALGRMVEISETVKDKGYDLVILSSRKLDKAKNIKDKFIVATGQRTTQEAIKVYRLGAKDYITKDFRKEKLLKAVMRNVTKNNGTVK